MSGHCRKMETYYCIDSLVSRAAICGLAARHVESEPTPHNGHRPDYVAYMSVTEEVEL